MKNFLKTAFLVILVVLLASTFFKDSNDVHQDSLDSNILQVEDHNSVIDGVDDDIVIIEDNNIFAKIGAGISSLIYAIVNFISSIIANIFIYVSF